MPVRIEGVWYQALGYVASWSESQSRTGRLGSAIVPVVALGVAAVGATGVSVFLSALHEGERNAPVLLPIIAGCLVFGTALFVAYVKVWLAGFVALEKVPLPDDPQLPAAWGPHEIVWVTGLFQLEGRRWQRFVCLPCHCARQPTGDLVFYQYADASTYMMGLRVEHGIGTWTLTIPPRTCELKTTGLQHWKGTVRPAAQLRALRASGHMMLTVACASSYHLRLLVGQLR